MNGLEFYSLVEFTPDHNQHVLSIDLESDFPGLLQVVAGTDGFKTYDLATEHAITFLRQKIEDLKAEGQDYKLFFEKNQFRGEAQDFEPNEVVKIYIANSQQTIYNSLFKARIFFVPPVDPFASYFATPTTLQ